MGRQRIQARITESEFDGIFDQFYRDPDPDSALLALDFAVHNDGLKILHILYFFCRIEQEYQEISDAVRSVAGDAEPIAAGAGTVLRAGQDPDFPNPMEGVVDSPEVMDLLWSEYHATGNCRAVDKIVSVLDQPDNVRRHVENWLRKRPPMVFGRADYRATQELLAACMFPIDYEKQVVEEDVDLDLHVALLAREGRIKFADLPFTLSDQELVHLAMKSAAVWSLRSVASDDVTVAEICELAAQAPGGAARVLLGPQ